MEARLAVAIEAIKQAAQFCKHIRATIVESKDDAMQKTDGSPVTIADIGAQLIINHMIRSSFPDDLIIGEEDAEKLPKVDLTILHNFLASRGIELIASPKRLLNIEDHGKDDVPYWTVDPIDGTKAFLRDTGQYCVCCAWIDATGHPEISVIAAPSLDCDGVLMYAVKGKGAYKARLNDDSNDISWEKVSIRRHPSSEPGAKILAISQSSLYTRPGIVEPITETLSMSMFKVDSQVKYMMVAMGLADAHIRAPAEGHREAIWDHAAGVLLVLEAGGIVTDQSGNQLLFPRDGQLQSHVKTIIVASIMELYEGMMKSICHPGR